MPRRIPDIVGKQRKSEKLVDGAPEFSNGAMEECHVFRMRELLD